MASIGSLTISSINLPQLYSLIPRARVYHISLGIEVDRGDVVIVSEEGLEAEIVIGEVPKFDGKIRGA